MITGSFKFVFVRITAYFNYILHRCRPEDEGWGWAGRDLPSLGQTWKRRFTDVTNIFNFSGINTEVRHLQGVTSVTLNVFGISNTSNSNSDHFVSCHF